ncbi:hypothetical protein [Mesorhizobium sp. WSM3862]|uniref:hypothetical protein n=1 Tax=Mesorhizobium sp. WSM3862 TaxID=632858 RepID=UPI000BB07FC9|nr:hypothetical protein [Mesorhizobium sp. WSM3862]PBB94996.1 hypothetical protein CK224_29305 [Mesorhizobium sp. WSM3862]
MKTRALLPVAVAIATVAVFITPSFAQQTFGGNDCTVDCSGHKAGYDWAEKNQISDGSDCSSNSRSFNEGCQTYLDDANRGSDEDDDGNEIED